MTESRCCICGTKTQRLVKTRCTACYSYFLRHKYDNPKHLDDPNQQPSVALVGRMRRVILFFGKYKGDIPLPAWVLEECDKLTFLLERRK